MTEDTEHDLLARGRDLAVRLKQQSRGHVAYDATMQKMADAFSMHGETVPVDDKDAPAARRFVEDATTVQRLVERPPRGPVLVGLVGAGIMLVGLGALASTILAFNLPTWLMVPAFLSGPLLGWGLTCGGRR